MSRDAINLDTPQLGHYGDAIMGTISSQVTNLTIVYSIVNSDADQRKHQSSASLAFVREIHRGPVAKWPLTSSRYCSFHSADRWYISTEYFVTSRKCVIKQCQRFVGGKICGHCDEYCWKSTPLSTTGTSAGDDNQWSWRKCYQWK